MNEETKQTAPLSNVQENALRYIAGMTGKRSKFSVGRVVNQRTLRALLERKLLKEDRIGAVECYALTDEGNAVVAAGGPLA